MGVIPARDVAVTYREGVQLSRGSSAPQESPTFEKFLRCENLPYLARKLLRGALSSVTKARFGGTQRDEQDLSRLIKAHLSFVGAMELRCLGIPSYAQQLDTPYLGIEVPHAP